jgi:hypothetical protein
LGLTSPPSQVLCSATTAICPSQWSMLPLDHRYLVCSLSSCPLFKLVRRFGASPLAPGPLVTRFASSGGLTRKQMALPSSQVTSLSSCPALRPRWCPAVGLALASPGLLPSASMTASAFPVDPLTAIFRPRLYKFRGSITRPAEGLAYPSSGLPLPP